jgi:hypothetical protein
MADKAIDLSYFDLLYSLEQGNSTLGLHLGGTCIELSSLTALGDIFSGRFSYWAESFTGEIDSAVAQLARKIISNSNY